MAPLGHTLLPPCSVALNGRWAENQVQPVILSSTSFQPHRPLLPSRHLNSSPMHTAHCIPGSCRYHLLHLAGSPPSSTAYLNATFPVIYTLPAQFEVIVASKHHWWHCTFPVTFITSCFVRVLITPRFTHHFLLIQKYLLLRPVILTFIHDLILTSSMQQPCEME